MKRTIQFLILALVITLATVLVNARMVVHHINVGQADATLLEFKTAAVLIDAGGSGFGGNRDRDHLIDYLDKFFQNRPDLNRTLYSFIITHPHIDHTRNIMAVMNRFRVRNFVDNGDVDTKIGFVPLNEAREFIKTANNTVPNTIIYNKIDAGDIGPSGYTTRWFKDLAARTSQQLQISFLNASNNCNNENNDSLVVLIRYRRAKMIVTGDAEWDGTHPGCMAAIPRMLENYGAGSLMDIDIYKVGHHGSYNGTNQNFLTEMSPKISIISAGHYTERQGTNGFNPWEFGHPRQSLVNELIQYTALNRPVKQVYSMDKAKGSAVPLNMTKAVYCTCWDGDIKITSNSAGTAFAVSTSN